MCKRYNELVTCNGETVALNSEFFEDFDFDENVTEDADKSTQRRPRVIDVTPKRKPSGKSSHSKCAKC